MGTRARWAAAVGVLILLGLAVFPASGTTPEGPGPTLNVTPSDDVANGQSVAVAGAAFFFETTVPVVGGTLQECSISSDGCGPVVDFTFDGTGSAFKASFTLANPLIVRETQFPCAVGDCYLQANAGGLSAQHHLTFGTTTSTSSTLPRGTTTTRAPIGTTLVPTTVMVTVTTRVPPTTTTAPTTTTSTVATTTTTRRPTTTSTARTTIPTSSTIAAPASTVPPATTLPPPMPPPPAGPAPSLVAVTPQRHPAGPPGSGLDVSGSGYACDTVYFFFDGTRVGSDSPDAAGNASRSGLSVPGDARSGRHRVTSSCEASGATVMQASFFQVLPVSVHRPAFVTALPLPADVSLAPSQLLVSAVIATGAILLIAFPYELFNSTMENNYDEIRGWFGLPPRDPAAVKVRQNRIAFVGLTVVTAVACGFLSPDFGLNLTSVALVGGMTVGLFVMAVVFSLPADFGIHRRTGEWGKLNFLPGSLIVSVVLVGLSRLLNFQPGYFYGALAGLAFFSALSKEEQGKMTAANWLFSLVVSVAAFFLRAPVSAAAQGAHPSLWIVALEACLALIFLWGVEGLAVAMLPMRFLDGRKVMGWSKVAWAGLFFLGLFATIHVLLAPGSGYVGRTGGHVTVAVMTLYAVFGAVSIGCWAYFRFRPQRWVRTVAARV
ncbi:MAG: hypothetical protein M3066_00290 [Actinomycetota bacterium]|nr:hypothetical protein [Actinomycetota bacterium]